MKHFCLFVFLILPFMVAGQDSTQASLAVFSADGNPFYLYVNGVKKNETARKEVRVDGINEPFCQVRLEFADARLGSVTRNRLSVSDGEDNLMDATYKVVRQNNIVKIRFYSMNPAGHKKPGKQTAAVMESSPNTALENPLGCITVFSEQGENFFLYLNGVQQNTVAQSRIRVDGLPDLYYKVRLVYADPSIPALNKNNVAISDGDDQLMDAVYKVTRSDNATRLRFYAMNPVIQKPLVLPGTSVYHWGTPGVQDKPVPVQPEPKRNEPVTKQEPVAVNQAKPLNKPVPEKVTPVKEGPPKETTVRSGSVHEPADWVCANEWPMWKADYAAARKNLASAKDDKERLSITEKLLSVNCFNTDQVIDMARLFNKEEARYNFVQSAFRHTIDYKNYYRVLTVFQSEAVKSRLSAYLQSNR